MIYNKQENKLSDDTECHISCKEVFQDGEDVTGKYKLGRGKQIDTTDQQQWQEMNNEEKDRFFERIAYPLTTQSDSEDELSKWIDKMKPDYDHAESYQHGFFDALQMVQDKLQSYNISRKQ